MCLCQISKGMLAAEAGYQSLYQYDAELLSVFLLWPVSVTLAFLGP